MCSADGRHAITFNGEIYNFRQLRQELRAAGVVFRNAQRYRGAAAPVRPRGPCDAWTAARDVSRWPSGIGSSSICFVARDPYGIKPLYLATTPDGVLFASQVKGLLAKRRGLSRTRPVGQAGFWLLGSVPNRTRGFATCACCPRHWTRVTEAGIERRAAIGMSGRHGATRALAQKRMPTSRTRSAQPSANRSRPIWSLTCLLASSCLAAWTRARSLRWPWRPASRTCAASPWHFVSSREDRAMRRPFARPRRCPVRHHTPRASDQPGRVRHGVASHSRGDGPTEHRRRQHLVRRQAGGGAGTESGDVRAGWRRALFKGTSSFRPTARARQTVATSRADSRRPGARTSGLVLHARHTGNPRWRTLPDLAHSLVGASFLRRSLFTCGENFPGLMGRELATAALRTLDPIALIEAMAGPCPLRRRSRSARSNRRRICGISCCATAIGRAWLTASSSAPRSSTPGCSAIWNRCWRRSTVPGKQLLLQAPVSRWQQTWARGRGASSQSRTRRWLKSIQRARCKSRTPSRRGQPDPLAPGRVWRLRRLIHLVPAFRLQPMSPRPIILTFVRYYLPSYRSGGPVRKPVEPDRRTGRRVRLQSVCPPIFPLDFC